MYVPIRGGNGGEDAIWRSAKDDGGDDSYLVGKDEGELQLVADSLGVTTTSAELGERAGSLGGSESGSDGGTSDHFWGLLCEVTDSEVEEKGTEWT